MKEKKLINMTMFDLLKGVSMIGVIYGHNFVSGDNTVLGIWFGKILYSVLMPAFFMVSGYWLKKKDIKSGIKAGVGNLLKFYIIVSVIVNVIGFIHRALSGNIKQWVEAFLIPSLLVSTKSPSRVGPMWFVFALFLAWSLFYIVINIKSEKMQMLIAVISAVLGGILMPLQLPFQIGQGLIAFFFVYCGYLLKKRKLLDAKIHPLIYLALIIIWIVSIAFGSMNMYAYDVQYGIFSIVGSLCGSYLIVRGFLYLNLLEWPILDGIRWMGRCSMWILCVHTIEYAAFPWGSVFGIIGHSEWAGSWLHFAIRFIVVVIICMVIQRVQNYRIKVKYQK